MACCKVCSSEMVGDEVQCDGICGNFFHAACFRRTSKSSSAAGTTCRDCSEIKPCHILRFVKEVFNSFSSDQSLIAEKIAHVSANWANIQLLYDDLNTLNDKIDKLSGISETLNENSRCLLERSHELRSRVNCVLDSVDDLRSSLDGCDRPSSSPGADVSTAVPIMEDIRRNIKQVKNELGSWSSAVSANSELIISIASDVRAISQSNTLSCASPGSAASALSGSDGSASSPTTAPSSDLTTLLSTSPAVAGTDSSAVSQLSGASVRTQPQLNGRLRRRGRRNRERQSVLPSGSDTNISIAPLESPQLVSNVPPPDSAICDVVDAVRPSCAAVALRPAALPRHIFVSRVHHDTTEDDVVNFISSSTGTDRSSIVCRRIDARRGQQGRSFSASFKVLVPDAVFQAVLCPDIWPSSSIVREFIPKTRLSSATTSKNSSKNVSMKSPSTMPT